MATALLQDHAVFPPSPGPAALVDCLIGIRDGVSPASSTSPFLDLTAPYTYLSQALSAPLGIPTMAASPLTSPPDSRRSWENLSSELLTLIFEQVSGIPYLLLRNQPTRQQLRETDPGSLAVARRLCRRFDAIATPVAYNTLVLNERIVEPDAGDRYPLAFRHIAQNTNHVVARSDLDPRGIRSILVVIQKLVSLRFAAPRPARPWC